VSECCRLFQTNWGGFPQLEAAELRAKSGDERATRSGRNGRNERQSLGHTGGQRATNGS